MSDMVQTGVITISFGDLAVSALLVLFAGLLSLLMRLRIEGKLAVAAIRTVVQLLLLGYILKFVFRIENIPAVMTLVVVMVFAASRAAVGNSDRSFKGATWRAFVTMAGTGLLTTYFVTGLIVSVDPWWKPQYMVPILGMILGNGLTGISLSIDHLLKNLSTDKQLVEMELSLGASAWEAARGPLADSMRRGMTPIINSMMVVGIVSIPGMMTGQILSGTDPMTAVNYQIVVMFMLAAATSLGCIMIGLLTYRRMFNRRHQLVADRIIKK